MEAGLEIGEMELFVKGFFLPGRGKKKREKEEATNWKLYPGGNKHSSLPSYIHLPHTSEDIPMSRQPDTLLLQLSMEFCTAYEILHICFSISCFGFILTTAILQFRF